MCRLIKVSIFLLLAIALSSAARTSSTGRNPNTPKALYELKDAITKGLGFQSDDVKISGFDVRDALVGHSVAYEFDVDIGKKVLPLKLLEDVNRWEYVDLPIFRMEDPKVSGNELVDRSKVDNCLPVLEPFQLAGPMELWIQDAKDMRISLPHDMDAGVLKKVILAEGAVVTVKGARSVGLRHPVELPLPLNRTNNGFASGILSLAEHLRQASLTEGAPLLSLRIVGSTSLTSPTSPANSPANRLKLKRLAPGLVELSSPSKPKAAASTDLTTPVSLEDATSLLTPTQFTTMWPLTSINASNSNLLGFEALLSSVLGPKANKKGSFKLLKADVSAQTYMKIGFQVEKKIKVGDGIDLSSFPAWRTKPEIIRMHFEVLAKVDGDKIYPERVTQVNPFLIEDTAPPSVLTGNITMSTTQIVHPPPDPFTL